MFFFKKEQILPEEFPCLEAQLFTWTDWSVNDENLDRQYYNVMLIQDIPGHSIGEKFAFAVVSRNHSTIALFDYKSKKVFEGKLSLSITL